MSYKRFDRDRLLVRKLSERKNQLSIKEIQVPASARPAALPAEAAGLINLTARKIIAAREKGRSVMMAFGAHAIKNGLGTVLIRLIKEGWITHLATNGAGIIHDWEIAYQGLTGESVRENVTTGQFGICEETGKYKNLAIIRGAAEKLGYGESVGKMISAEGLEIPGREDMLTVISENIEKDPEHAAATLDLYNVVKKYNIAPGFLKIPHPFREYSVQCSAYEQNVPFTGHPMIGHDIIYNHPFNCGAAIGRTALTDFLSYTWSVCNLNDGVYLSVGSAVMSPMIFEKALAMCQNLEIQSGRHIDNHFMLIVDLAANEWDWNRKGEPPMDNPAYYLRYCKTFNRMGGEMHYLQADNRDFLTELYHVLNNTPSSVLT